MNGDFKVRGPDERTHIFRLEAPGKYQHYSRPVWEKYALERLEDNGRFFTWSEVQAAIDALKGDPITEEEVKWVAQRVKNGIPDKTESGIDVLWDQETDEPKADPNRPKVGPLWQCCRCQQWFGPETKTHKLSFQPKNDYCERCFDKTIGEMGRGWSGA